MKRLIAAALTGLTVLSLLSGCHSGKQSYIPTGDGLHVDSNTAPVPTLPPVEQQLQLVYYPEKSLNPYETGDFTNRALFGLLYQGLFSANRDYEPVPILCKSYTRSKDMKTYTFYIEDATFPDGSLLTAQDVAASLKAAQAGAVYSGRLRTVSAISVTEDGGVCLELTTPYENLPLLLDIPIVRAADVAEAFPLGTGAYRLDDGVTGRGLLRRNDWWCRSDLQVTASYIPLIEAESPRQIRDVFEFGQIGLVCTDPGLDSYVDYRSDLEVWQCENGIFLYLGCNETSAVFSDQAIRQALGWAIDRQLLIEEFYHGFASEAFLPASPDSPWYSQKLADQLGYDPQKLTALIEEKGLTGTAVQILVNKSDTLRVRVARKLAAMLSQCGLNATTKESTGTAYTNALKRGTYDLHLGQTRLSPNMDLSAFFDPQGALNYGGMADAAILAMCREAMANSGNYYTLHQMVLEDSMLCPILFRSYAVYAARGLLSKIQPARDQIFFYSIGKTMEDVFREIEE